MMFAVAEEEIGFVFISDDTLSHARSHTRTDKNCESALFEHFVVLFVFRFGGKGGRCGSTRRVVAVSFMQYL